MSFTTEQPSSLDFEVCCICMEEFSNDNDLAAHLLKHAEESAYQTACSDNQNDQNEVQGSSGPTSFADVSFSQYGATNFMSSTEGQKATAGARSGSPEVFDIDSDDDDPPVQSSMPVQTRVPAQSSMPVQSRIPTQNRIPVQSTMSPQSSVPARGVMPIPQRGGGAAAAPLPRAALVPANNPPARVRQVGRPSYASNSQVMPSSKNYPPMQPPFNCRVCSNVFNDPKQFREHLLTHEKPRPYSCHICKKNFAYKGTLRQHLKMHVGERMHQCPTCNKRFTIKSVLKRHCEEAHGIFSP